MDEDCICLPEVLWVAVENVASILAIIAIESPPHSLINNVLRNSRVLSVAFDVLDNLLLDIDWFKVVVRVKFQWYLFFW